MSLNDLEILAEFRLSQICTTNFGPFGEIHFYFPVQFPSRSHFAKIEKKYHQKQCEKHKKECLYMKL